MDRRQELVFIGVRMNRGAIVAGLDRCLVTRVEASRLRADPNERLRQDVRFWLASDAPLRPMRRQRGETERKVG